MVIGIAVLSLYSVPKIIANLQHNTPCVNRTAVLLHRADLSALKYALNPWFVLINHYIFIPLLFFQEKRLPTSVVNVLRFVLPVSLFFLLRSHSSHTY